MPVMTIVEDYIFAALKRGVLETLEDGTFVATIPDLPGVISYGANPHECARELYGLVEETIRVWLQEGHSLPVIDGIDLNSEKSQILASYHIRAPESPGIPEHGTFYEGEAELEGAFEARGTTA